MATYRLGRSLALALLGVVVVLIAAGPVAAEPWPVRSLPIFARTAVGLTKAGPFTEMTKPVGFGGSVTWRFATDPILQWSSLTVERADRGTNGKWGPFKAVGTTLVDDTGVAYYAMTSAKALAVSIRALYPATGSLTTADSRSPAREAVWLANPAHPLDLVAGTAIDPSIAFTTSTKVVALGKTVTWRWLGPARAAQQTAAVWIAVRATSRLWGPFAQTGGTVQFDAHGVATYRAHFATPTWIAVRIYLPVGSPPVPETWSAPLQARWR